MSRGRSRRATVRAVAAGQNETHGATRAARAAQQGCRAMVQRTLSGGRRAGIGRVPRRTERGAGTGTVARDRSGGGTRKPRERWTGAADREPPGWNNPPPEFGCSGPRTDADGHHAGKREPEPQGRVWLKQATGHTEAQTVKVVGNGEGGPKREWKPATRRSGTRQREPQRPRSPGSGFRVLGASEGRATPGKDGREEGRARRRRTRTPGQDGERGPRG
jgi:hypothetical protein